MSAQPPFQKLLQDAKLNALSEDERLELLSAFSLACVYDYLYHVTAEYPQQEREELLHNSGALRTFSESDTRFLQSIDRVTDDFLAKVSAGTPSMNFTK